LAPLPLARMSPADPIMPQRATPVDVIITGVDWLFEPYWSGDRLIARLDGGHVTLTDRAGEPAGAECAEAADAILRAIDADAAVIDGVWTGQPFGGELFEPAWPERRRAFVALDLVELDGESLTDVPYQERRRLLTSVLEQNARVRISPAVRLPLEPWLHAWRASGFTQYVAKHMNSRYRPGEQADDWLIVSAEPQRKPMLGLGRPRRSHR
jgi:bifunctional non-homologous end joining protein LigD